MKYFYILFLSGFLTQATLNIQAKNQENHSEETAYIDSIYNAWDVTQKTVTSALNSAYNWINSNVILPYSFDHKKAQSLITRAEALQKNMLAVVRDIEKLDENISREHTIRGKLEKLKKDCMNLQGEFETFHRKLQKKYTRKSKALFKYETELQEFEENLEKKSKKIKKINFI